MKTLEIAKRYYDWIVDIRRDIHMNPEPSFAEFRTSKMIREELEKMGIEVSSPCETGVLGIIKGKEEGKVVALRADMDALSVNEETGLPYASKIPGMMHACGHDAHVAMLLGAAKILSEMKDEIKGTVKFIFQPAEEVVSGAKKMIECGVLENPKVDAAFGMHIWSDVPTGKISLQPGPILASADLWNLTIKGKSCHGSSPWQGVDAVTCMTAILNGFHTIVTRQNDIRNPMVINVGTINAGERFNVVPGKAEITGTNRSFTKESRENLKKWMESMIKSTCEAYGCEYEFTYEFVVSPTINDESVAKIASGAVAKLIGEENLIILEKGMGSEDFSEYTQVVPGALMFLGARNEEKRCNYSHHSNFFNIDEDALSIGAASYAQVALDYLG